MLLIEHLHRNLVPDKFNLRLCQVGQAQGGREALRYVLHGFVRIAEVGRVELVCCSPPLEPFHFFSQFTCWVEDECW